MQKSCRSTTTSKPCGTLARRDGVKMVELASASNMKRTWATWHDRDWLDPDDGEGREFLRAATHVKNVWVPYGE